MTSLTLNSVERPHNVKICVEKRKTEATLQQWSHFCQVCYPIFLQKATIIVLWTSRSVKCQLMTKLYVNVQAKSLRNMTLTAKKCIFHVYFTFLIRHEVDKVTFYHFWNQWFGKWPDFWTLFTKNTKKRAKIIQKNTQFRVIFIQEKTKIIPKLW